MFILILLVSIDGVYKYWVSPSAKHNIAATQTLENFYLAFISKDYVEIAQFIKNNNPQIVINERHWYGDISKYEIKSMKRNKNNERIAKIIVKTIINNQKKQYTDTIKLVKQTDKWVVESYHTNLQYKLP